MSSSSSSAQPPSHRSKHSSSSYHRPNHQHQPNQKQQRYVPKSTTSSSKSTDLSTPKPSPPPPPLTTSLRAAAATAGGGGRGGEGGGGGGFVAYLPHDEAVAAGLGADAGGIDTVESQGVVDLLNDAVGALLRSPPRDFWRGVARNSSLCEFLDSYLQFRHRWYDLPHRGPKGAVAGVVVGELELCRRVFMVLYRISSNKDPGSTPGDSLSVKEHTALLQEKKLLDLPKLLDICAIYGHDNGELTSSLVRNAINAQPKLLDGISSVVSQFLSIVHTMHDRCMSSLEVLTSSGPNDHGYGQLDKDFLEVLDFINDAIVTLDAFVDAYQPAALLLSVSFEMSYGVEELLNTLARLHDSLLPSLLEGFKVLSSSMVSTAQEFSGSILTDMVLGIRMLSKRIVRFGWKLLEFCYLNDQLTEVDVHVTTKMFPTLVEDPAIRGDILVQTLKDISREATYTFNKNPGGRTFLQALEEEFELMCRINILRSKGWIYADEEQFQFLSQLVTSTLLTSLNREPDLPVSSHGGEIQQEHEEAAIVESKISQIKDLFPGYGKGFLSACLEAYNQNPEEVIQRILDGTLHQDLLTLDTSLEQIPQHKPPPSSSKDKGKGISLEPVPESISQPPKVDVKMQRRDEDGPSSSSTSSASYGRYTRKTNNELPDMATLDSRTDKDVVRSAILEAQFEYEDEYDDSFDDLGLSVVESGYEETEGSNDRGNYGKPSGRDTESSSHGSGSRWSSQKKPQYFVKDGKNYSYKVAGSVAVSNAREAAIVNRTQKDMIYGLGRGGNLPAGAINRHIVVEEDMDDQGPNAAENSGGTDLSPHGRGRGGRRGGRNHGAPEEENEGPDAAQSFGRGSSNPRGGGGRRGRGRNQYRKDRAMKKHFAGIGGY